MFYYQSSNPCNCSSSPGTTTPSCQEVECNCIDLCGITISPLDPLAPNPCGGELILDLTSSEYEHDTCACGADAQKWYLAYFDPEVFSSVTVSESGDLNATTITPFSSKASGKIIVKFVCGKLSSFLTVLVGINQLCVASCSENQTCNPCTGICTPNTNVGVN